MFEAFHDLAEPDLVPGVKSPLPRCSPPSAPLLFMAGLDGARSREPSVPPPIPKAPVTEIWSGPKAGAGEPFALEPLAAWPSRQWWASTGTSTTVHVLVLTILALLVTRPDTRSRMRPIEILRTIEDSEPLSLLDPLEQLAVEIHEPVAGQVADVVVDQAIFAEPAAVDVMAAAFVVYDDPVPGLIDLDTAGMMARVGGGGPGAGGFGGNIGRRLARAGAKTGDVQVSLSWENFNDIDLHVITPAGERIFFAARQSSCRGALDVDMNAGGPQSREPVENIFWPKRAAPNGEYQVFVHHYARRDPAVDKTAFDVHVLVKGVRRRYSGYVQSGEPPTPVTQFVVKEGHGKEPDDF